MCRTAIACVTISQQPSWWREIKLGSRSFGCFIVAISPALIEPYPLCYEPRPRYAATTLQATTRPSFDCLSKALRWRGPRGRSWQTYEVGFYLSSSDWVFGVLSLPAYRCSYNSRGAAARTFGHAEKHHDHILFDFLIALAVTIAASAVIAFIHTNVVVGWIRRSWIPCTASAISGSEIGKTSRLFAPWCFERLLVPLYKFGWLIF